MILLSIILFIIGIIILIKGADFLIDGASSISLRLKISPMVIGLTVVAFGTSAPELVVSATSAIAGNTNIALGNIIGSNIANILLILGICSLITPLVVQKNTVWKEIPMSLLAVVVLSVLGLQNVIDENKWHQITENAGLTVGHISFSNGLILLAFFIIFIYYTFGIAKVTGDENTDIKPLPLHKSILFIIGGLVGLVIGSSLTVDNAITIARTFGASDTLIGLTLVAVGTSLPELSTSIVAARKKKIDLLVGNVVGSNIFNIFFILGITSLIKPIPLQSSMIIDLVVVSLATIILFVSLFILRKMEIGRREGACMLFLYIAYLVIIISRN
jgi:cation:H+ antiporter